MESLNSQIESIKNQLDSDKNLTDDDKTSLGNFNNSLQAKLFGMKDVQISPKSKETKLKEQESRDKELADKEQEALEVMQQRSEQARRVFDPMSFDINENGDRVYAESDQVGNFQGQMDNILEAINSPIEDSEAPIRELASEDPQSADVGELARYNDLIGQYKGLKIENPYESESVNDQDEVGIVQEPELDSAPIEKEKANRYQDLLKAIKGIQ